MTLQVPLCKWSQTLQGCLGSFQGRRCIGNIFLSGGEVCLDLWLSLTFFRATNSFSALARNPTSSSYLDDKDGECELSF